MNVSTGGQDRPASSSELIGGKDAGTLWGLFCERLRRSPDLVAFRDYDMATAAWRDHTWRTVGGSVDRFRAALDALKLDAGDRVAILLPNGLDWVCLDLAAHASGLVVVALYPHDSSGNNAYILGHADARLLLVDTEVRWQELADHRGEFPGLRSVWICDGVSHPSTTGSMPAVHGLEQLIHDAQLPPLPARRDDPAALATLIYTSGTTGRPKGVMLSHAALLWNAEATAKVIPPRMDDVFLSILPLAHAFERTLGYYLPMMGGSTVAYARTPQDPRADMIEIRPTVMLGVPRLFERIFAAIHAKVGTSFVKRRLLHLAGTLGWLRFQAARRKRLPALPVRLLWQVLERLVVAPVRAAFGDRMRVLVSGGAPLDPHVCRFLLGLGLPLVEGYGLTEAAPIVTATTIDENVPGTVGRPLQGIDLKLTPQGELLVHTPSVMMGYWNDPDQTKRVLGADNWLSTGDLAEVENGRISIRCRMDEMIVLSIGEKVNPSTLEADITRDPLFEQVAVFGNRRPFLSALVVLNREMWLRFCDENRIHPMQQPNAELAKERVIARLDTCLSASPRHAQIRAVHLGFEPWTIKAELVTPTLKIKRKALEQRFGQEIDALYASHRHTLS